MLHRTGRGYLESDFRIFHLKDVPRPAMPMHYHDFRKIMVLIDGSIRFALEDQMYSMEAGDVMLVETGTMHRAVFTEGKAFERMLIYLSDNYFAARPGLDELFLRAGEHQDYLLRIPAQKRDGAIAMISSLSDEACSQSRFPLLLQQSRVNEFLIELNDLAASCSREREPADQDGKVKEAIGYVNRHLTEDLSTKKIAGSLGLSESCLSQRFRKETGLTLRSFVADKRLSRAFLNLKKGCTAAEACSLSGFTSYSSFYRAYMERYGASPKNFETVQELDDQEPAE